MRVRFKKKFQKRYKTLPLKVREQFTKRLALFSKEPTHPQLRLHSVEVAYPQGYSINITGDVRAIFQVVDDGIEFVTIGTHAQLYK